MCFKPDGCGYKGNSWGANFCGKCGRSWDQPKAKGRAGSGREGSAWDLGPPSSLARAKGPDTKEATSAGRQDKPVDPEPEGAEAVRMDIDDEDGEEGPSLPSGTGEDPKEVLEGLILWHEGAVKRWGAENSITKAILVQVDEAKAKLPPGKTTEEKPPDILLRNKLNHLSNLKSKYLRATKRLEERELELAEAQLAVQQGKEKVQELDGKTLEAEQERDQLMQKTKEVGGKNSQEDTKEQVPKGVAEVAPPSAEQWTEAATEALGGTMDETTGASLAALIKMQGIMFKTIQEAKAKREEEAAKKAAKAEEEEAGLKRDAGKGAAAAAEEVRKAKAAKTTAKGAGKSDGGDQPSP